ncbi:RNA polymerase sigma factor [Siphonobacter curvatus]|uniref:RNA polymerase sigma factor n=1 Tax=Siphonobacter curvatus TaxID=2094562 RepID=UPI0013FD970D|nr:RNA polymerase sigma-70 factor [Siphonobacter curvatus]
MKAFSDLVLVNQLKAEDDRAAFNELYLRYWKVIYDIAAKKLQDPDLAKDVVHDLFVELWYKRHTLVIHTTFAGYLYTMLNHRFIDLQRRKAVHTRAQNELLKTHETASESVHDSFIYTELETRLMHRIEHLPPAMRQIFLLSRQEQLSPQEIAERLSLSTQTVKNQIQNALLRLKEFQLEK